MSEDLHNIDDLFRKALEENQQLPSQSVWDNIDKALDKKKVVSISKKYNKLKWAAAVLLLFSLGMAMYTLHIRKQNRDTVQLASLPAGILSYFTSNYPQDTLVRAYINSDSSYVIFSKNNGAFATVFTSNGTFVSRVQLQSHDNENVSTVVQSALPSAVQTYLSTTYPNYVFNQAFSFSENGTLLGYVVCVDANGTKYAVAFDASGNFVKAITIR